MSDKYILRDREVVAELDLLAWAKWFEGFDRRVAHDDIGGIRVSTVFLGIDHRFGDGPPIVFETMIFGGAHDQYQTRCSTYAEAEKMHQEAVDLVTRGLH